MEHKGQKKVTVNDLNALYKKGLIDRTALSKGTELIRPASKWYEWAQLNLLLLGSTLLLVGIIFFFAYNWNDIGRFMKFSVIEVSIIGCILGAFRLGIDEISSKALLTSASVLVGVLLAVFGQTYQTGADPYELFAGWAILIFGWVLVTEFAQLWTLWIVLINTGVILYWMQVLSPVYRTTPETLFVAIGLLNLFFMGIKEIFCRRGNKWLKATWLNHLLLLAVLVSVTIPTSMFILFHRARERFNGLGPVFWILIISGGFYYYRYVSKEIEPLSMIIFCQSYVLLNILFKFFFNSASRGGNAWIFFTFGWIIIGVIALAVYWIKILAKELNNKRKINHV